MGEMKVAQFFKRRDFIALKQQIFIQLILLCHFHEFFKRERSKFCRKLLKVGFEMMTHLKQIRCSLAGEVLINVKVMHDTW